MIDTPSGPRTTTDSETGAVGEPPDRLAVSVNEAARLLGISRDLAYDLVARGEIPAIRLGRRLVVARRTLQHLLAGQAVTAGDRPAEAGPAASAEAS